MSEQTTWTPINTLMHPSGRYRVTLATDPAGRWRWVVTERGRVLSSAMAGSAEAARDEAMAWIEQREEEVRR